MSNAETKQQEIYVILIREKLNTLSMATNKHFSDIKEAEEEANLIAQRTFKPVYVAKAISEFKIVAVTKTEL